MENSNTNNQHVTVAVVVVLFSCLPLITTVISKFINMFSQQAQNQTQIADTESVFTRKHQPEDKTFPSFKALGEDIMVHVLSFVADAPFETNSSHISTLTHCLPLVSKQFHRLVQSTDCFWKDALFRQATKEPPLWHSGLKQLCQNQEAKDKSLSALLDDLQEETGMDCLDLYKEVLQKKIRCVLPVFYMGHPIRVQNAEPYGLHFFEPRYRRLIAEVMDRFPVEAKQGQPIVLEEGQAPPVFIHAHAHPLRTGSPAALVQVIRCRMYQDGRADVYLLPIAYLRMEKVWEVPNSGHLLCGQGVRIGERETAELDDAGRARIHRIFTGDW